MRYALSIAFMFPVPCAAIAAEAGEGGYSFAASLMQMLASLAVVLGLICLVTYLSRRWLKGGLGLGRVQSNIRIVETRHLSPKKSLLLVEVAGEYLLLSSGTEGISFIKQIDMLEEIEVVEMPGEVQSPLKGLFQDKLDGLLGRLKPSAVVTLLPRNN